LDHLYNLVCWIELWHFITLNLTLWPSLHFKALAFRFRPPRCRLLYIKRWKKGSLKNLLSQVNVPGPAGPSCSFLIGLTFLFSCSPKGEHNYSRRFVCPCIQILSRYNYETTRAINKKLRRYTYVFLQFLYPNINNLFSYLPTNTYKTTTIE